MKFFFHENADAELDATVEYYEGCRLGLGLEFAQEVHAAIKRAMQFPNAGSPMSESTRRHLVNRFPFGMIYQVKSDAIFVVAVADLRRRPGYWMKKGNTERTHESEE